MISRSNCLTMFLACFSFVMLSISTINSSYAEEKAVTGIMQGTVIDIINVTGYTYAEVDTGNSKVWVAGPTTALKAGDSVTFSSKMPMKDFHSKSMARNFPLIYFISSFSTNTNKVSTTLIPPKHDQIKPLRQSLKGINGVEGGQNIAEIHSKKEKLNGKSIRVRGQVTRFSAEIMGKNWLHIQDSSSFDDLTVTTSNTVAVGDIVIIEGTLELDKDYDYGYIFPVIVQNATVTKE